MECQWCKAKLSNKTLYSIYGYESLIGPICNECVRLARFQNEK